MKSWSRSVLIASMLLASPAHAQLGDFLKKAKESITNSARAPEQQEERAEVDISRWKPPVDQTDKQRLNKNYKKTIVQGAAIGGILAGATAAIIGGDETVIAVAAIGGTALGGAIGKKYADKFEKMSKSKKRTEDQISALEANNVALGESLDGVTKNIDYIKSEIAILKTQLRRGAIEQATLDGFRSEALKDLEDAKASFDRTELTYAEAKQTLDKVKASADPEVQSYTPRAERVVADLDVKKKRADRMRTDVSTTINALGKV